MSATFSLRYFTVTINQPSNGRISVYNNFDSSTHTTTFNAAYGSVIRTTVSANTGYSFGSLTINGTSQSNNGNYTIVANTAISATININYYTVLCTQPANGSLRYSYGGSEHSSGSVPYNGSVKVIARANSGYSVSAVYKNGSSIGNNSSTNITGNTTFTANMSAVTYYSGTVYSADTYNGATHYGIPTHNINGLTFRSEGEYVYLSPIISNSVYITYTNTNTGRVKSATYTKINDHYIDNCTSNPFNFKTNDIVGNVAFPIFLSGNNVPIKVTIQFN